MRRSQVVMVERCHWCKGRLTRAMEVETYRLTTPHGDGHKIIFHSSCVHHWNQIATTREFSNAWMRKFGDSGVAPS